MSVLFFKHGSGRVLPVHHVLRLRWPQPQRGERQLRVQVAQVSPPLQQGQDLPGVPGTGQGQDENALQDAAGLQVTIKNKTNISQNLWQFVPFKQIEISLQDIVGHRLGQQPKQYKQRFNTSGC